MAYLRRSPIPVVEGGTGLQTATAHDVLVGAGTSAITLVAPSATSGVPFISQGASADPVYGTAVVAGGGTGAVTLTGVLTGNGTSAITANTVTQYGTVIAGATNAVSSVAPSATSGVPYISQGASANPVFGTAVVAGGGTGNTTFTAYSVICAGTTATGVFQNVSGVGTAGQVLTSAGASALPTWSNGASVLTVTNVTHATGAPYVVLSTDEFITADVTGGVITINLPNAPTTGRVISIKDKVGLSATSNITVTTVGGAVNIDGATTYVMNAAYQAVNVIFDGTSYFIY